MADEKTSPETAKKASRVLRDASASADAKSAAASALSQADDHHQRSDAGDQESAPAVTGSSTEPTARKFVFAPLDPTRDEKGRERKQSPVVEVADGSYHRIFRVEDQPFAAVGISHAEGEGEHARTVYDVTPEEEAQLLLKDGHFVEVKEDEAGS